MKQVSTLHKTQAGRVVLFALFVVPLLVVCGIAKTNTAHAANWRNPVLSPDPGSGNEPAIPAVQKNSLEGCVNADGMSGGQLYSPGITGWISQQAKPWVVNIPVAYGQTTVNLDYNTAYAVCSAQSIGFEGNTLVRTATVNGGASLSGIAGDQIPVHFFFDYNVRGFYIRPSQNFVFTKPGGFTTSGTYTITVNQRTIIHYLNGAFVCNTHKSPVDHTDSLTNFGPCEDWLVNFKIDFTVPPQPNHNPTGNLSGGCVQGLNATFNDQDGATFARIMRGGSNVAQSDVSPLKYNGVANDAAFSAATYQLQVQDRQPNQAEGTGSWVNVGSPVTAGPCATLSCGSSSIVGGTAEAGVPFELDATVTYGGSTPPPNPNVSMNITGPAPTQNYSNGQLQYSANGGTATITPKPPGNVVISQTGTYTVAWKLTTGAKTVNCSGTFSVYSKPYLQVNGGDVSAGGGVVTVSPATFKPIASPSCTINNGAQIASWNKRNTSPSIGGTTYDGAGTSVAAFALGDITDFSSAQGGVATPLGLSFANNTAGSGTTVKNNPQAGQFGGQFGAAPGCDATIVNDALATGHVLPNAGAAPGAASAFTVNGGAGTNNIYVLKGANVVINNNISDAGGANPSWADVTQIPHFQLVVLGGNIYIGPNVTNLDGLYYAAPDSNGVGGQIYTCANGTTPVANTNLANGCAQQLTVNGSLMAKRINLLRTAGTLNSAPNGAAAESINYSPEMWITTGGSSQDNAYTSLPPVL